MMNWLLLFIFGPALLYLAITIPLILLAGLLAGLLRGWMSFRRRPLQDRNQIRAGFGGFGLALAVGLAVVELPPPAERLIDPIRVWLIAGLAGFGALYLVVGVLGSQGARFDFMSLVWWSVLGLGCAAALLVFGSPI